MHNFKSRFELSKGKWVYIQIEDLANHAKDHIRQIRDLWTPPEYFFHLQKGGHIAALRLHTPNEWYGKVDLSKFFNNITRHRVTRSLKRIGYSFRDAEEFAVASTVLVNHATRRYVLPYGFVQSPLLASISLDKSDLGNCLRRLHEETVSVSVYVDDIVVSADSERDVAEALSNIYLAAINSRFPINEEKSRGPSSTLNAFNIELDMHELEITAKRYEKMCGEVLINGTGQVSDAILNYVQTVNPAQAEQMLRDFPGVFGTLSSSASRYDAS